MNEKKEPDSEHNFRLRGNNVRGWRAWCTRHEAFCNDLRYPPDSEKEEDYDDE